MNKNILKKALSGVFTAAIVASSVLFAPCKDLTFSNAITASAESNKTDNSVILNGTTYKEAFEKYFPIGGVVNTYDLRKDYILDNYNLLSDENCLKPDSIIDTTACQESGSETEVKVSLKSAAPILKFCEENGIPLFGSTFVWYSQTPNTFFHEGYNYDAPYVDKETMNKRLESFIKNTFEALSNEYPDLKIAEYEVCKEVFVNDGGGLRPASNNMWMKIYESDEYIINAFKYARQYAPKGTKLYYSDYNEYIPEKTNDICNLAKKILNEGNYIDGIGMEAWLDIRYPQMSVFQEAFHKFEELPLDIMLTELCVGYGHPTQQDHDVYRDVLLFCAEEYEHISGVLMMDSLSCEYSSVNPPSFQQLFPQQTIQEPIETRIRLLDDDTGKPVILNNKCESKNMLICDCNLGDESAENRKIYELDDNPTFIDYMDLSSDLDYTFNLYLNSINNRNFSVLSDETSVTRYHINTYELVFKVKFTPTGDVNADDKLNITDAVLLQKWLLAAPDTQLKNWKAADYNNDNVLDIFDLISLKKALLNHADATLVEPDNTIQYPSYFHSLDDLKLYLGPDESYASIASIPSGTILSELGYNNNNSEWIYTKHEGQYGWIKTVNEDGSLIVHYEAAAKKPVIYLYPEKETDVQVKLELTESELSTTYPKYNGGWNVTAYPDGTLLNKADGTHHKYLFWDSTNCRTRFDFSKGFCVAGSDTESFLREKLTYMGLTESEMNEFIVYWLPLMEHNAYNLISFQNEAYTDSAKLNITPNPDSLLRVFMAYVPLENAVDIEPQQLEGFERNGFTVVEWGGTKIG